MTTDHSTGAQGDATAAPQGADAPIAGRLLTVSEAAALLQLNETIVRRWLKSGRIRSVILADDAGWRITEAEVQRLLTTDRR